MGGFSPVMGAGRSTANSAVAGGVPVMRPPGTGGGLGGLGSGGGGGGLSPAPLNLSSLPAMPSLPQQAAAPNLNVYAQKSPALEALQSRYDKYLNTMENGPMSGRLMDQAAARLRDAREGGRQQLQASEGYRGVASSPAMAQYDAETQRGMQQAIADTATERERTLGDAMRGGLGIAEAPEQLALSEKQLGLQAYEAQQNANKSAFDQFLALLNAQRSSPVYTGY